ncbi:ankyrin repeat protein [Cotia virus SPAn232]|uniref:Ankyrin repeat protein n=2 Tax=Cotia virus TaxID=39444 RepID=H6TAC7_9POXV|nr:ankyrin repeat protein [Cotia virus SPAn232]AFB76961.1 ankyrin repeat protein [Cotia virus SPAn232]AIT70774.1 ankyrin repeat protein [Cotia virus]
MVKDLPPYHVKKRINNYLSRGNKIKINSLKTMLLNMISKYHILKYLHDDIMDSFITIDITNTMNKENIVNVLNVICDSFKTELPNIYHCYYQSTIYRYISLYNVNSKILEILIEMKLGYIIDEDNSSFKYNILDLYIKENKNKDVEIIDMLMNKYNLYRNNKKHIVYYYTEHNGSNIDIKIMKYFLDIVKNIYKNNISNCNDFIISLYVNILMANKKTLFNNYLNITDLFLKYISSINYINDKNYTLIQYASIFNIYIYNYLIRLGADTTINNKNYLCEYGFYIDKEYVQFVNSINLIDDINLLKHIFNKIQIYTFYNIDKIKMKMIILLIGKIMLYSNNIVDTNKLHRKFLPYITEFKNELNILHTTKINNTSLYNLIFRNVSMEVKYFNNVEIKKCKNLKRYGKYVRKKILMFHKRNNLTNSLVKKFYNVIDYWYRLDLIVQKYIVGLLSTNEMVRLNNSIAI